MQNIPERKIIERCINNDRKYQEMLYRNYADKMYNICLMYADSEDSANDILQDGFIKVFRNLKKFKFEGSFEGWIRRIIVNTALEHYRKKKRETEALQTIGEFSNLVMEEIIDKINAPDFDTNFSFVLQHADNQRIVIYGTPIWVSQPKKGLYLRHVCTQEKESKWNCKCPGDRQNLWQVQIA